MCDHDDDALQDPSYLLSVVETIADPSSPPIHHLLDAYATFVNRIRSHSDRLEACNVLPPAFVPLSTHRDNFVQALRRDVRLARLDPFLSRSHRSPSLDEITIHLNISMDSKQYARDSSLLCHHALCALTTILRFPTFYFAFPEHHLSSLFGDVLDLALAVRLPTLNEAKTYSLLLWALGCHRLPLTVLGPRRDDLVSALQQSLDPARRPDNIVLDALKAISHTIKHYPSAFLDLLSPLLPRVISNLGCESDEHRIHASIALGKFANALINQTELSLTRWKSLSDHITSFLEPCCRESQTGHGEVSFLSMVRAAFLDEPHAHHTHASARMLSVLASLIVLCGPPLYEKPMVLHFILRSLAMTLRHKRSVVRALHPHVWRCFVWTFSQMLFSPGNVEPALVSSAFHVIQQEVSGGIGVALACVLLSDRLRISERGDRVSLTLLVIDAMVRTECKHTRREGFMFLQALTNEAQARQQIPQSICEIPASVLFDRTIIHAGWDSLSSAIHSIPKVPVPIHWPEENEIAQHCKTLLAIWKQYASKAERLPLDPCLVGVWLSILLVYSHQLECGKYTTATAEMLRHTAAIVVEFLPPVALGDHEPDWGSWNVHDQLRSLTFIDSLWVAMRRAFVDLCLAEAAELILTAVLKYAFHVLDLGVRTLWGRLCATLMTTVSPSFLRDTHNPAISQLIIRSQRELWGVVATSLAASELSLDWKELIKFLAIPICIWVLSEPELEAWEALIRHAVTVSGDSAMVIEHIVSQYLDEKEVETWDSVVAILGFLLTCAQGHHPPDELLSTIDVCLAAYYGRAHHSPETLAHSLKLLDIIRRVIVSSPGNVMHILRALRNSLCLWIKDHTEVMSNDEFNSVAISLYSEALKALEVAPLSIQSLQDTEEFLASAFSRIPTPAIAPFAFERFWRATYHGRAQFCNNLPPKIKSCLSCFVAAYGGDLADGLSSTTESQSQSISNGSQVYSFTGHQHQVAGKPTVLRQLQEYESQVDMSSLRDLERSMNSSRILKFPPGGTVPRSHPPEILRSVILNMPDQKWEHPDKDDASKKRSRITRSVLRSMRGSESEPATRDTTPVNVPRMTSVPLKRRKVLDGIQVPTFREISRWKTLRRSETSKNINNTRQDAFDLQASSPCSARRRTPQSTLPSSVGSDEDDLDWENFRLDGISSSDADDDRSLVGAQPSSPPRSRASASHDSSDLSSESSQPRAISRSEDPPSASPSPLRRAKTTLSRLDALQDVYSCVANDASQIPLPELMQATRLVHQIGAVLTKQVDKQMRRHRHQTLGSHRSSDETPH